MKMKKNSLAEIGFVDQSLNIKVDVNQNDIVNIAVAEREAYLTIESNKLQKEIRELNKQVDEMKKDITNKLNVYASEYKKPERDSISSAISKIGFNSVKVSCTLSNGCDISDDNKIAISYSISHKSSRSYASNEIYSETKMISIPSDIKKLKKEVDAIELRISNLVEQRLEYNAELRSIPAMERQVRAKVSKKVLENTKGGKEFLKTISGMKSLEMPK